MPLVRKPSTGMRASTMIRTRTEMAASSRTGLRTEMGSLKARMEPASQGAIEALRWFPGMEP